MLRKADFTNIQIHPSVFMNQALDKLEFILNRRINGVRVLKKKRMVFFRFIYYIFLESIGSNKFLFNVLARFSLVQVQYVGSKK